MNGDGLGDGVVGAYGEDVGEPSGDLRRAGRVYLYRTGGAAGVWEGAEEVTVGRERPAALALSAVPNPLASRTTVRLDLPWTSAVVVEVLDVMGRRVVLLHEAALGAGTHALGWAPPSGLPGGVYLLRLVVAGEPVQTQRVTLAR